MARRYKPLPAGQIVWLAIWHTTAEVLADDGAGLVYVLERAIGYDYQTHKRRSQIRPATPAEADAHRQRMASINLWRRVQAEHARLLAAAASVTPAPADPAG